MATLETVPESGEHQGHRHRQRPLRVALLVHGEKLPGWAAALAVKLASVDWAKPLLLEAPGHLVSRVGARETVAGDAGREVERRLTGLSLSPLGQTHADVLVMVEPDAGLGARLAASYEAGVWWCRHGSRPPVETFRLQAALASETEPVTLFEAHSLPGPDTHWTRNVIVERQLRLLRQFGTDSLVRHRPALPAPAASHVRPEPQKMGGLRRALSALEDWATGGSEWRLGYRDGALGDGFRTLDPPAGAGWRDPFVVEDRGRRLVLFTERRRGASRIAVIEYLGGGRWGSPAGVLEDARGVSYPFAFRHEGAWYMIPEMGTGRTVELYEAVEFPYRWRLRHSLANPAYASGVSLCEFDGRWWLFASVREPLYGCAGRDLHVFSASDPLSREWQPHPLNPVVSDVRCGRPAGRLFHRNGAIYRPARDSACGETVHLQRVAKLRPDAYEEHPAARLTAESFDARQVGTWNEVAGLTVADVLG